MMRASHRLRVSRGAALVVLLGALMAPRAEAQGVTLNQYRAAPTVNDGFAIARPIGIGHLGFGARLDVDYALEPLRVNDGAGGDAVLVDHQLGGQLGLAIGLFDRFVGSVRLPVSFVMNDAGALMGDATPDAVALGDVTLGARWVLYGEREDMFAVALAAEATIPTAEAANEAQDLAGEAGPSFSPEIDAELRFSPVRITGELGLRFREAANYQRLQVGNELTWGLGIGVDIIEDLLDATLEGFGATPLDDFAAARRSPVELLLGARVRPGGGLVIGVAAGAGLGLGYGSPRFRALLNVGWSSDFGTPPAHTDEAEEEARVAARRAAPEQGPDAPDDPETPDDPGATPSGPGATDGPVVDHDYAQLDRDGDRIVDAMDRCPLDREDYDEIQDDDGCPEEDADADRVADVDDRCPLTAGVANRRNASCHGCPELACVSEEGTITITQRVEFETDSDTILASSEAVLTAVGSIISTNPQLTRIRIEGHTDDRDSDEHNLELSRSRAASVRAWLVAQGIEVGRFEAWGCGEAHPLESNRTRRGRAANRRVEFFLLEPPTAGYTPREGCVRAE